MTSNASCLYQLADLGLEAWDQFAQMASPHNPSDISPPPPHRPSLSAADRAALDAPVDKLHQPEGLTLDSLSSADFKNLQEDEFDPWFPCKDMRSNVGVLPRQTGLREYSVQWHQDQGQFGWGAGHKMPSHLPEYVQRALLMADMCDYGVLLLRPSTEEAVKHIDSSAKVYLLQVLPSRSMQLMTPSRPGSNVHRRIAVTHSVILINSPLAGDFVLDPTGEQYGHPHEHRFLAWSDYKELYVLSKKEWDGPEVWNRTNAPQMKLEADQSPDCTFWKDVRKEYRECFTQWLEELVAKHGDLKKGLDDEDLRMHTNEKLIKAVTKICDNFKAEPLRPCF